MGAEDNFSFQPVVGRAPLILGGHDFHSITEAVAAPVERRPSLGWWIALGCSASLLGLLVLLHRLAVLAGDRHLGPQRSRRLGVRHHQLRLLDRHRPRRHADLGHPLPLPPEVAHRDQPLRRGDDDLRRHVRADLPGHPRRPAVAGLLAGPVPESRWASGRTSAARCCGTSSPSRPTAPSRCSSGTSA